MDINRRFWLVLMGAVAGMTIIACSCSSLHFPLTATPFASPTVEVTSAPVVTSAPAATSVPAATSAPTTTTVPAATSAPTATTIPVATSAPTEVSSPIPGEAMPGLAGKWIDPDSSGGGTISTIVWENGGYVVTEVVNPSRGGNELKSFSWKNGVLTWEYCPSDMQDCIIQYTISLSGNTLTVDWTWSSGNNSGTSELKRQP